MSKPISFTTTFKVINFRNNNVYLYKSEYYVNAGASQEQIIRAINLYKTHVDAKRTGAAYNIYDPENHYVFDIVINNGRKYLQ